MSSIRQRLLTFSIVRKGMGVGGDPFSALAPFINPIANDFENREFVGVDFQMELKKRYGIELSRDVTAVFVERLIALKYVRKDSTRLVWCRVSTTEQNEPDEANDRLDHIVTLAEDFYQTKKDLVSDDFSEESFLEALITVLLDQNTALKSAVEAVESSTNSQAKSSQSRARSRHEYYASEFIAWTCQNKKEVFGWLAELSATALVTEALIEVRTPSESNYINFDIVTYLDTPFLMQVLGCCGTALKADSLLLVETLKKQRVSVSVLTLSIEELKRNLSAVLNVQSSQRVGPTAKALLYQEVTELYLREILSQPNYYIEQIGINIIDSSISIKKEETDYFTEDDSRNFYAMIFSLHDKNEPRQHDVDLITWIMQKRKGITSSDVLRTKYILITRNDSLVQFGVRIARERCGYPPKTWGPAISARDLAGVLWTIVGQEERSEISKKQLILSCDRARAHAPQIVKEMLETLKSFDPDNAGLLWAAVQRPAYLSIALDAAASTDANDNKDAALIILKKVQDDLVADERQRSSAKLKKAKEQSDAQAQLAQLVEGSLKNENSQLSKENDTLLEGLQSVSQTEWTKAQKRAILTARLAKYSFNILIIIVITVGSLLGSDTLLIGPIIKISLLIFVGAVTFYFSHRRISIAIDTFCSQYFMKNYEQTLENLLGEKSGRVRIDSPLLKINGKK